MPDLLPLRQPLALASGQTLSNRIAKSATSEALANHRTGAPSEQLIRAYERWGRGGAGLLITGNVIIRPDGRTEPGNVIVQDERHLPQLARWAEAAQAHGASLWMQINHAGRQSPRRITTQPVAPSSVALSGFAGLFARPRALQEAEIEELIGRYATAAQVAQRAGFAGVQIHAAHGYLVSQFLSPLSNRRMDRWGGDIDGRMRLLLEIIRAVRAEVGAAFPVGVKLNSADFQRGGFSEQESMQVVRALEAEGIELLEISGGSYEKSAMMGATADGVPVRESTRKREAYFLDYAREVRSVTKLPLMLTGGMRTAETMNDVIGSGAVDMVGMARPLIVEPDLPTRLLSGATQGAVDVQPRVGIRLFDDMLQIAWYQAQLRRMGNGRDPDIELGRWRTLVGGFFRNYAFNPLQSLLPRRDVAKSLPASHA